jgi:hypothetical protein
MKTIENTDLTDEWAQRFIRDVRAAREAADRRQRHAVTARKVLILIKQEAS